MNAVESALYDLLKVDAPLLVLLGGSVKIYNHLAPRAATPPWVIISQQSGREENRTPRREMLFDYQVKGVATSLFTAGQIADRIDIVLHDATLSVSGWDTAYWIRRNITLRYIDTTESGEITGHAGAVHKIRLAQ